MLDRSQQIKMLVADIQPLNQRRIFLETKIHASRQVDIVNLDEKEKEMMTKERDELTRLNRRLGSLVRELRKNQCMYEVIFEGEVFSAATNQPQWNNPEKQILFLETFCYIDTIHSGWRVAVHDPCVHALLNEIHNHLLQNRYSNFRIIGIRRLTA